MKKIMLLIVGLIFVCVIIFIINDFKDSKDMNYNTIIEEIISPDEKYKAVIFERNINATTKESYQLSILKSEDTLGDLGGNIYVSYQKFSVNWIDNKHLSVYNRGAQDIFKNKTKWKDIKIDYEK